MTRSELYNKISPCGTLDYPTMVYLISNVQFTNIATQQLLLSRIAHNGALSQQDWLLFARSIEFLPNSPINALTIEDWLTGKCRLSGDELKQFLEFVQFTDGSQPTFILTENGDFIIAE